MPTPGDASRSSFDVDAVIDRLDSMVAGLLCAEVAPLEVGRLFANLSNRLLLASLEADDPSLTELLTDAQWRCFKVLFHGIDPGWSETVRRKFKI
jgi:hypothetical protein